MGWNAEEVMGSSGTWIAWRRGLREPSIWNSRKRRSSLVVYITWAVGWNCRVVMEDLLLSTWFASRNRVTSISPAGSGTFAALVLWSPALESCRIRARLAESPSSSSSSSSSEASLPSAIPLPLRFCSLAFVAQLGVGLILRNL